MSRVAYASSSLIAASSETGGRPRHSVSVSRTAWATAPAIDPAKDLYANLFVYRMEAGKTPPRRPGDAWAHLPLPRTYAWNEVNPLHHLESWLKDTKAARNGTRVMVRDLNSALWPPEADFCALVRWRGITGRRF
ncbi:hypothetical protein [Streptomyces anthocyanicus]|uniref:hypothetical protein n=1 Tax=Streptomyces anthocyanicus TaxID=68174 RepID=UPI002F9139F7|nr:hypothetical protein OH747_39865 [Streptomyces anthocyanicus]